MYPFLLLGISDLNFDCSRAHAPLLVNGYIFVVLIIMLKYVRKYIPRQITLGFYY